MVAPDYPSVVVVRTDEISLATKSRGSEDKRVVLLAASIPIAISIVAGLLGWLLVGPGRSLLVPTAEVALLVVLASVLGTVVLSFSDNRQLHRLFIGLFAVLGSMAIAWTYFGVLPASVVWNSSGPDLAAKALQGSTSGCQLVTTGSVGLISAPYKECVDTFKGAVAVRFAKVNMTMGYVYLAATNTSGWFPDECSRHLVGNWWAYSGPAPSAGCPVGYQFSGAA